MTIIMDTQSLEHIRPPSNAERRADWAWRYYASGMDRVHGAVDAIADTGANAGEVAGNDSGHDTDYTKGGR